MQYSNETRKSEEKEGNTAEGVGERRKGISGIRKVQSVENAPNRGGFRGATGRSRSWPDLEPIEIGEGITLFDNTVPFEEKDRKDQYEQLAHPMIGSKAQIQGLGQRSKFNGIIVTIESWDKENEIFVTRIDETNALLKAGIENLRVDPDYAESKSFIIPIIFMN